LKGKKGPGKQDHRKRHFTNQAAITTNPGGKTKKKKENVGTLPHGKSATMQRPAIAMRETSENNFLTATPRGTEQKAESRKTFEKKESPDILPRKKWRQTAALGEKKKQFKKTKEKGERVVCIA